MRQRRETNRRRGSGAGNIVGSITLNSKRRGLAYEKPKDIRKIAVVGENRSS